MKTLFAILTLSPLATAAQADDPNVAIADGDTFICTWADPDYAAEKGRHGTAIFEIVDLAAHKVRISRQTDGYPTVDIIDGLIVHNNEKSIGFAAVEGPKSLGWMHSVSIGIHNEDANRNYHIAYSILTARDGLHQHWFYTGTCAKH